jgi:flagellar hook-associated protein FlgK
MTWLVGSPASDRQRAVIDAHQRYILARPENVNMPEKKRRPQMKNLRIGVTCVAIAVAVVLAASACSLLNRSTPTATFKAFYEASKKKDAAGMKKSLSKGTLDMFDKLAKEQNKSTDDMLKEVDKDDKSEKMPETRNEKINGDTATLEVKNDKTGKWDPLPFVKEDGEWKIALDKFLEDMLKGLGDKMPESK